MNDYRHVYTIPVPFHLNYVFYIFFKVFNKVKLNELHHMYENFIYCYFQWYKNTQIISITNCSNVITSVSKTDAMVCDSVAIRKYQYSVLCAFNTIHLATATI